ncbi:MAG: hypothetical protein HYU68_14850 [Bacteroidetes bacterium]|nr:hypothetical protein [Bacteroidota bacterium]
MITKQIYMLCLFLATLSPIFGNNEKIVKYISEANDLAYISLELKSNGRFIIVFDEVDGNKTYKFKGKWEVLENNYLLKFKGFKVPKMEVLFEQNQQPNQVKIINKRTASFSIHQSGIWIWGVYCKKQ